MSTKTIKISEENYRWLSSIAGDLQKEEGRPVSIDKAIASLHKPKKKLSDAFGLWKDDKEMNAIFDEILQRRHTRVGRKVQEW